MTLILEAVELAGLSFSVETDGEGYEFLVARNDAGEVGRTTLAEGLDQARLLAAFTLVAVEAA